jgi:hypothetical protein
MRKKIYLIALASFITASVSAQFDMGGFAGTCLYEGDITNNFIGRANVAIGATLRYNVTPYIAVRAGLTYGRIGGDDKQAKNVDRKMRNLNFKSPIVELSLIGEYNIFGYNSGSRRRYPGMIRSKWTPYVFGGVSYFMFNPTTTYNGKTIQLKSVPTEIGKSYSTMQLSIPMGLGVKYNLQRFWTVGFELGFRKTFTDYLDDVSGRAVDYTAIAATDPEAAALSDRSREINANGGSSFPANYSRGNSKNLDAYTFIGITIAKDLGNTYGRRRR